MPSPSSSQSAGRGSRLLARILDSLIGGIPAMVLLISSLAPAMTAVQTAERTGVPLEGFPPMAAGTFLALVLWLIVFTVIQLTYLTTRGQTLGKMMCKVKIVMLADGMNGGFVPNVLLRTIVNGLIGMVPFYGIVDIFFIFREDRRCIHDLIAGTVVVKA
ncbi:MAG: RDD family protein [Candidatus Peribacteraceae bacterium]|nr:RDD family protein [Candidatus Peribacteraceae bacterium]